MESNVKVSDELMGPNDGRKKPWYVKKIEELEAQISSLNTQPQNGEKNSTALFADGFVAAMHSFQIQNKAYRQRVHQQILEHGPGYIKRLKGSKFRGFTI